MAPGSALRTVGIEPVGRTSCELANGRVEEYPFGLAQIELMGEVTVASPRSIPSDSRSIRRIERGIDFARSL
jgi:hypothetical protein